MIKMRNNKTILERVNENKVRTSIVIDKSLFDELIKLRKGKKLKSLSSLINELLWEWLEKREDKKSK